MTVPTIGQAHDGPWIACLRGLGRAGFLLALSISQAPADSGAEPNMLVTMSDGLVNLSITAMPAQEVLDELASSGGIVVIQDASLTGTLTISATRIEMRHALQRVLNGTSYQFFETAPARVSKKADRRPAASDKLWVFGPGDSVRQSGGVANIEPGGARSGSGRPGGA